MILTIVILLAH